MFDGWEIIRKVNVGFDPIASILSLVALGLGVWNRISVWQQQKRDWRRQYLCDRVDVLCDKAYSYWSCPDADENQTANNRLAVDLKMLLRDIEQESKNLDIDLGHHITDLKEAVTGGTFEEAGRAALTATDEKYMVIQRSAGAIREKLFKLK